MPKPTALADLHPDPENRRQHPVRNLAMVAGALEDVGAARSIVVDEHGTILAGNGVVEAAKRVGLTEIQVVDADGQTLIAVRRRGLTAEQKRALAMYDNRTGELAEWNLDQLQRDQAAGLTLRPWFPDAELTRLLGVAPETFPAVDEDLETTHTCPKCGYEWSGKGG